MYASLLGCGIRAPILWTVAPAALSAEGAELFLAEAGSVPHAPELRDGSHSASK